MIAPLRIIWLLIYKEFLIELRQKDFLFSVVFFALAVILIINFSFSGNQTAPMTLFPLVYWVPLVFSATLVIERTFNTERDSRNIELLILFPKPIALLYLAKVISTFLMMFFIHLLLFVFVFFFLNLPISSTTSLLLIPVLFCDIGLSTLGTLLAGVFMRHRNRDALLPILLFPLSMPLLIGGVQMTRTLTQTTITLSANPWLTFLLVLNITYVTLSYLLFEFLFEEH